DPVLAANIGRLGPSFLLAQHPDDLLFREPARLHVHPLTGDGLYPFLEEISGLSSPLTESSAGALGRTAFNTKRPHSSPASATAAPASHAADSRPAKAHLAPFSTSVCAIAPRFYSARAMATRL